MNRFPRAAFAAILLLASSTAFGATRYVTDELRISVRTGTGDQYRIIEVIGTGTQVEALESSGEWTRVTTPEGNTGWVRSQYLVEQPVAEDRLRAARAELDSARDRIAELQATLRERVAELESALAESRAATESARERIAALESEKEELEARLAQADRGLELYDQNQRLANHLKGLNARIAELEEHGERLADRSRKEWFVIGAAVLLGGMLFGIIVTRIPWRGRRDRMF